MQGEETNIDNILSILARNTAETIGLEELRGRLTEGKKLNIYWGCAPTRVPSVAYLVPLRKLKECFDTGKANIIIFLADLHSYMDKGFTDVAKVKERTLFYQFILTHMLRLVGFSCYDYTIVRGSDIQLRKEYQLNLLKFSTLVSIRDAQHAGKEVVKQDKQPRLSSLLYPLMQCLDEIALNADIQLGGLDQRKIFALGRDFMPKLGLKKCVYLLNPLVPSLSKNGKMSSSDPTGKLEFLDSDDSLEEKIRKAYCCDGDDNLVTNPCLSLLKYVVYGLYKEIEVEGKNIEEEKFMELWKNKEIVAQDLKKVLSTYMKLIVNPVRAQLLSPVGKEAYKLAYE